MLVKLSANFNCVLYFFRRSGNDLLMTLNIELVEALCGFQKIIRTLDQRDLLITVMPGTVIKPGDIKCIVGEGMPVYRDPFTRGKLTIRFAVNFPKSIDPAVIPTLEKCLPPRQEIIIPDGAEECTLTDFDPEYESRQMNDSRQAYDEDEGNGTHLQCPTQ